MTGTIVLPDKFLQAIMDLPDWVVPPSDELQTTIAKVVKAVNIKWDEMNTRLVLKFDIAMTKRTPKLYRSLLMNKMTCKILDLCETHNIQLTARHLPGLENSRADYLSQLYPQHKWELAPHIFRSLDKRWGPHMVDHMATATNSKLPRYNSHFHKPDSEGVDTLLQDWCHKNNWVVLLIALIPKVVSLLQQQRPKTTIVVPLWKGQPWFQDLLALSSLPLVPIPNVASSFITQGQTLPEPMCNKCWQCVAFRICGRTELKAGPAPLS
jgi:hypothetical protein